jgi:hypothetical protein
VTLNTSQLKGIVAFDMLDVRLLWPHLHFLR